MINTGVTFQPGSLDDPTRRRDGTNGSQQGIQEAIKVLSLRLPKVVGAQASVSAPLLTSQGSGGSPHVDSIVQQVLQRYMPADNSPAPAAPMGGYSSPAYDQPSYSAPSAPMLPGPSFSGDQQGPRRERSSDWNISQPTNTPRVVVDNNLNPFIGGGNPGDFTVGQPGQPFQPFPGLDGSGTPGGSIAPAPDLRGYFDWMTKRPESGGGGDFNGMPSI